MIGIELSPAATLTSAALLNLSLWWKSNTAAPVKLAPRRRVNSVAALPLVNVLTCFIDDSGLRLACARWPCSQCSTSRCLGPAWTLSVGRWCPAAGSCSRSDAAAGKPPGSHASCRWATAEPSVSKSSVNVFRIRRACLFTSCRLWWLLPHFASHSSPPAVSPGGSRDSVLPSATAGSCCQATGGRHRRSRRFPLVLNPGGLGDFTTSDSRRERRCCST